MHRSLRNLEHRDRSCGDRARDRRPGAPNTKELDMPKSPCSRFALPLKPHHDSTDQSVRLVDRPKEDVGISDDPPVTRQVRRYRGRINIAVKDSLGNLKILVPFVEQTFQIIRSSIRTPGVIHDEPQMRFELVAKHDSRFSASNTQRKLVSGVMHDRPDLKVQTVGPIRKACVQCLSNADYHQLLGSPQVSIRSAAPRRHRRRWARTDRSRYFA